MHSKDALKGGFEVRYTRSFGQGARSISGDKFACSVTVQSVTQRWLALLNAPERSRYGTARMRGNLDRILNSIFGAQRILTETTRQQFRNALSRSLFCERCVNCCALRVCLHARCP